MKKSLFFIFLFFVVAVALLLPTGFSSSTYPIPTVSIKTVAAYSETALRCKSGDSDCIEKARKSLGKGSFCQSGAGFDGVICDTPAGWRVKGGNSDGYGSAALDTLGDVGNKLKGLVECTVGAPLGDGFFKKCILLPISGVFLAMAASITEFAGTLLDYSVDYSLNIASNEKGLMDVVKTVWGTFRDIANMFFIFALLYIAFATMLQVNGAETKRMLIRLVVVGLLLNFSLFFTQIVIDVSNVLAYNFYTASAQAPNAVQGKVKAAEKGPKLSISTPFANHMRIVSLYSLDEKGAEKSLDSLGTVAIMGTIFLLIAAFVFFAAAIMFIIRTATLIFLMVMAPIAFVMYVLPATQGYAKKWWDALLGQAFVAPIFLLLVWVTLSVMDGLAKKDPGGKTEPLVAKLSGADSSVDVVFIFFLISALMLAALFISKQMAGWTAATAISLAQKGTRFAGKNTLGAAGSGLMGLGAAFGRGGFKKTNRALNFLGGGLRNRSYDVGSIPGAQKVGIGAGKDTKNLAQWFKGASDNESKRKGDVFKGIEDPSARLRYLESMGKDDQKKIYEALSPSQRAELRIKDEGLRERLDSGLTVEERDKTEKARNSVASADNAATLIAAAVKGNLGTVIKGGTDIGKETGKAIRGAIDSIPTMNIADMKKVAAEAKKAGKSDDFINKDVLGKMGAKQFKTFVGESDVTEESATKFVDVLMSMQDAKMHIQHLRAASRGGDAGAELIANEYDKKTKRMPDRDFGRADMSQTS